MADVGLEFPPSPVELVGDSGGGKRDEDSVIRDNDEVRSSDCARFCSDRGFEICSFILVSSRESEPRFRASSVFLVREGIPEPLKRRQQMYSKSKENINHDRWQRRPIVDRSTALNEISL